jgi:aryl-alcohol dehydrogenase (NADP+)
VYNAGASEEIVGRVLRGRRDRVVLATKVGIRVGDTPQDAGLSRSTILHKIDQSLRRLKTYCVDLYYLHQPDPLTPLDETLSAVDDLVRSGKVRAVGASNFPAWQVCRMRWLAEVRGSVPVTVTQPMYNLLARSIEPEFLPMCRALSLSTVVYNPLAGGLLTGKHAAGEPPAAGTRFDGNTTYQERYWHPENFRAVNRLNAAAQEEGRSLLSLALCWLLCHTPIDCVILGASSLRQLTENLEAASQGRCSAATLSLCEEIWPTIRGISPACHR